MHHCSQRAWPWELRNAGFLSQGLNPHAYHSSIGGSFFLCLPKYANQCLSDVLLQCLLGKSWSSYPCHYDWKKNPDTGAWIKSLTCASLQAWSSNSLEATNYMLERLVQFQRGLYLTAGRKQGHTSAKFASACWHLAASLVSISRIIPRIRGKSRRNGTMTHPTLLFEWLERKIGRRNIDILLLIKKK